MEKRLVVEGEKKNKVLEMKKKLEKLWTFSKIKKQDVILAINYK